MKITMSFNHLTSLIVGMALLNFGYVHTDLQFVDELKNCTIRRADTYRFLGETLRTVVYVVNNTNDNLSARINWQGSSSDYNPCPVPNTKVAIPSKSKVAITKFYRTVSKSEKSTGMPGKPTFIQRVLLPGFGFINLKQSLDGYSMSYSLTDPNVPEKTYSDRSPHLVKFTQPSGGYYTINFYSKYTGSHDDIVYEIDYHKE